MAFENILSVSGKSGLFKLVGQMKNGIIVESIEDGKRFPVHGASKVSALEEISIYTEEDEVPLKDVFKTIYEKNKGKAAISHKEDNAKIKAAFEEILPGYDKDRVYVSDMGKVFKWYNTLIEHEAYDPTEEEAVEEGKDAEASDKKEVAPKKAPAKKAMPKTKPKASTSKAAGGPKKAGNTKRGS